MSEVTDHHNSWLHAKASTICSRCNQDVCPDCIQMHECEAYKVRMKSIQTDLESDMVTGLQTVLALNRKLSKLSEEKEKLRVTKRAIKQHILQLTQLIEQVQEPNHDYGPWNIAEFRRRFKKLNDVESSKVLAECDSDYDD